MAIDNAGNVYFGSLHSVFRVDPSGTLTCIAGNGHSGYTGDGGPATTAQLMTPAGIAVDGSGNIYVADRDAAVIRKIAGGTITTVAGTGTAGYNGDGGLAAQSQLDTPMGLAADSAGNLFVADSQNHRIRKIAPNGMISTVAGNGSFGYGGDNGQAISAELNQPEGIAVDAAGNLFIADTVNDRVREVSNGVINTVAGTGVSAVYGSIWDETGVSTTTGDNGPAINAAVVLPTDVAVDRSGNMYIADYGNARIRVVAKSVINTVAGLSDGIPITDGQAAISTRLTGPTGLGVDSNGNVYFAEGSIATGSGLGDGDYRIWKITTTTGILNAVAGDGLASYSGDGGAAAVAQLNGPASIAVDAAGNLYFADSLNHRIRRITAGGRIDTVAGNGIQGFSGDGGQATGAQLNNPLGVAVDGSGNLYIADTDNNRIRKVTANGVIQTIAGYGNASFYGDETPAVQASVHAPEGLAVAPDGTLYIADTLNQRVRKLTPDGIIHTLAGNGNQAFSGDSSNATQISLNLPTGVALDGAGNVYIADHGNNRVRKVTPAGAISTIAGNGNQGSNGDGFAATSASLVSPQNVAVDSAGNVYIAEFGRNALRKVGADGTISTFAGNGSCCYSGDGGPATAASLNAPWGITVDSVGNVYFTDFGNNAVRAIASASGIPTIGTVTNGASNQQGPIAPGEVVVIYGSGLGPGQLVTAGSTPSTQLSGVTVLFNGTPAQMLYASSGQISVIAPPALSGTSVQVVVIDRNFASGTFNGSLASAAPALFTADTSGMGQAAATNQDGSANRSGNGAAAGSTITLLATGIAGTMPTVTVGGMAATVVSTSNAAPGVTAIAVQVPFGLASGAEPILIGAVGVSSPAGVTITLQ